MPADGVRRRAGADAARQRGAVSSIATVLLTLLLLAPPQGASGAGATDLSCAGTSVQAAPAGAAGTLAVDGGALVSVLANCTFLLAAAAAGQSPMLYNVTLGSDPQASLYVFDAPWADPSALLVRLGGQLASAGVGALFVEGDPSPAPWAGPLSSRSGFMTLVYWTGYDLERGTGVTASYDTAAAAAPPAPTLSASPAPLPGPAASAATYAALALALASPAVSVVTVTADIALGGALELAVAGTARAVTVQGACGPSSSPCTLDGGAAGRLFRVSGGARLELVNLQLVSGAALLGGCALASGAGTSLTLQSVTMANCSALGDGGGALAVDGAELVIADSLFESCSSGAAAGGGIGAIFGSSFVVDSTTFEGCNVVGAGGAVMLHDGSTGDVTNSTISACTSDMGGAAMLESSILTMESTKVSNCTAITQGGAFLVYHNANATLVDTVVTGGSTSGWGGGFLMDRGNLTMIGGAITYNNALYGGAFMVYNAFTLLNGTFLGGNTGGAIFQEGALYGDIECVELWCAGGSMVLDGVTAVGNSGPQGGVVYTANVVTQLTVLNSVFEGNTATGSSGGGAIYVNTLAALVDVVNSSFVRNSAGSCGAIAVTGAHKATVTDSSFADNAATGGDGGALCFVQLPPSASLAQCVNNLPLSIAASAGEIGLVTPGTQVPVQNLECQWNISAPAGCTVELQVAQISTLAPQVAVFSISDIDTGEVYFYTSLPDGTLPPLLQSNSSGGLSLDYQLDDQAAGLVFYGGMHAAFRTVCPPLAADAADLAAFYGEGSAAGAAVLEQSTYGDFLWVRLEGVSLEGNTAAGNGGGVIVAMSQPVTQTARGFLQLLGGTMSNNSAGGSGGAVYVASKVTADVQDATLTGNTAAGMGGALYMAGSTVEMHRVTMSANDAVVAGGALALMNTSGTLRGCELADNAVSGAGGALAAGGSSLALYDSTLTGNLVRPNHGLGDLAGAVAGLGGAGGAVAMAATADFFLGAALPDAPPTAEPSLFSNTSAVGNSAPGDGGALSLVGVVSLTIDGGVLVNNTAGGGGGAAVLAQGANVSATGLAAAGNVAATAGGAFTLSSTRMDAPSALALVNATVTAGAAAQGGAVAASGYASVTLSGSMLQANTGTQGGALYVGPDAGALQLASAGGNSYLNNSASYGAVLFLARAVQTSPSGSARRLQDDAAAPAVASGPAAVVSFAAGDVLMHNSAEVGGVLLSNSSALPAAPWEWSSLAASNAASNYGPAVATLPVSWTLHTSAAALPGGNLKLPISLRDMFGQTAARFDLSVTVAERVESSDSSAPSDGIGLLTGLTTVPYGTDGTATFDNLFVRAPPDSQHSLVVSVSSPLLVLPSPEAAEQPLPLVMTACLYGEVYNEQTGSCECTIDSTLDVALGYCTCKVTFYMNRAGDECLECPEGAFCPGDNHAYSLENYWHQAENWTKFYECEEGNCEAQDIDLPADHPNCREGQTGPLCAVCEPGWSVQGKFCALCGNGTSWAESPKSFTNGLLTAAALAIVLLLLFIFQPLFPDAPAAIAAAVHGAAVRLRLAKPPPDEESSDSGSEAEDYDSADDGLGDDAVMEGEAPPDSGSPRRRRRSSTGSFSQHYPDGHGGALVAVKEEIGGGKKKRGRNSHAHGHHKHNHHAPPTSLFAKTLRDLKEPVKVILEQSQILTSFTKTMQIHWPSIFFKVIAILQLTNLDFVKIPKVACLFPNSNMFRSFMVDAFGLTAFISLLITAYVTGRLYLWARGLNDSELRRTWDSRCLGRVVMILSIAYTPVAEATLGVFSCQEIEGVWYLLDDVSLRCYTPEWYYYRRYAIGSLIVYVLGIPVTFFIIFRILGIPAAAAALIHQTRLRLLYEYCRANKLLPPELPEVDVLSITEESLTEEMVEAMYMGILKAQKLAATNNGNVPMPPPWYTTPRMVRLRERVSRISSTLFRGTPTPRASMHDGAAPSPKALAPLLLLGGHVHGARAMSLAAELDALGRPPSEALLRWRRAVKAVLEDLERERAAAAEAGGAPAHKPKGGLSFAAVTKRVMEIAAERKRLRKTKAHRLKMLLLWCNHHIPMPPIKWHFEELIDSVAVLYGEHYVYAWWWELFEFSRKLMFSCVVGFISRGSAQQVVVATTLSFFTFLFFREVAPFASRNLYIVGYVSNFTLFAFLYIALLLKMSVALGAGGNNSIGFTLLVGALTFGIFIVPAGVIIRSLFNYKLELAQPVPPKSAAPKKGKAGAPPKDAQDATGAAEKAATAGAAHEARHSTGAPHAAHHAAPSHAAAHHAAEKHAASEHPSH